MEAAQQLQPEHDEGRPEAAHDTAARAEPLSGASSEQPHDGPKLAAVPSPAEQQESAAEEAPERAPQVLADVEEESRPQRAPNKAKARERVSAKGEQGASDGGPSRGMIRTFKERWEAAQTPEARAEALKYGLERGVPMAKEFAEAAKLASGAQHEAPPAPAAAPQAATPATGAATAGSTPPPPAAQPAEPTIYGHNRKALKTAGEKAMAAANLVEGLGKTVGWDTSPSEPMKLFEGVPGVEPIEVTGNAKKELVELLTREVADFTKGAGGEADSPFKRRLQIGMLLAGMAGPGLVPLAGAAMSKAFGALTGISRAISGQVLRWRRR